MATATRRSGVLLHPTSLPGPYGIGDLGPQAYAFIDALDEMKQSLWQILPLTPTSIGDSPYFSPSAMAGNPLLISPDFLRDEGLLGDFELPPFPEERVDFGWIVHWKRPLLEEAFRRFHHHDHAAFDAFVREEASWLDDFALFMAIKEENGGRVWTDWPSGLATRDAAALQAARERLSEAIDFHRFTQYLFRKQWKAVRDYANAKGIEIIGDVPIFVAHDSADVWAQPQFWQLDEKGHPLVVAGVPPDYFSETGQLWGNPLYDWSKLASTGYEWWVRRFQSVLKFVDWIRVDHFRGFAGYWEIPAGEKTAINGRWVPGPGKDFFQAIKDQMGELPILAEDLGVLTPDVIELRDHFDFPGMKILQFAFDAEEENNYFPHTFPRNCVVYTGTHDNDTTVGWYRKAGATSKALMKEYLGKCEVEYPHWELIRAAHASVANFSIVPLQDLFGLDSEARMNTPGTLGGNWGWRFRPEMLSPDTKGKFARMTQLYDRKKP